MNHLSILLIIIGLIFCITPAQSRTFTSTDGRTMEADVVSVTKDTAIIKRGNRQFTIPLTSLSQADREYLAEWRKEALKNKIPKLDVAINSKKSNRQNPKAYEERIGSFEFEITIENEEIHYSLENGKAHLIVLGRNCENPDTYCVMQKNEYGVDLEIGDTHEWQGDKMAFTFDDRDYSYGYDYYGFIFLLKNADGKIIYQRVTPSKFEWGIEPIFALEAKEAFDKTFKSKGSAYIRLY
ncbi:MAG: hypothetical protein ACPGFB_13180 [Verrucomicrobiales bacterium]